MKESSREHVRKWQESGLTITEYCRQAGVKSTSFHYWKSKYEEELEGSSSNFIPILSGAQSREYLEFESSLGVKLRAPLNVSAERLKELVECLS